jgi:hypothetical protein
MPGRSTKPVARNRYKLSQAKQQMEDAVGGSDIEIELDNGETVSIPHPLFYSKDVKADLKDVADDDAEGIAKVLLGDDFDKYVEAGEDPEDLQWILLQAQQDAQATLAGRTRPTRS